MRPAKHMRAAIIAASLSGMSLAGCSATNPGYQPSPYPTPNSTANVTFDADSGLGSGYPAASGLGDASLYDEVQSGGQSGGHGR